MHPIARRMRARPRRLAAVAGIACALVLLAGLVISRGSSREPTAVAALGDSATSPTSPASPPTSAPLTTRVALDGPLSIVVELTPAKQIYDLQEPMSFTIHLTASEGAVAVTGDESGCTASGESVQPGPLDVTFTELGPLPIAPGRQEITWSGMVISCKEGVPVVDGGHVQASVGAAPLHNGPQLPSFGANMPDAQHAGIIDDLTTQLGVGAIDPDGFIPHFIIDWGDGSPMELYGDLMAPRDSSYCFETASVPGVGGNPYQPYDPRLFFGMGPLHTYASSGTYTVTTTAVSTACDGTQEQRTTSSVTFTVPFPH